MLVSPHAPEDLLVITLEPSPLGHHAPADLTELRHDSMYSAGHFDKDTESHTDAQPRLKIARSLVLMGLASAIGRAD